MQSEFFARLSERERREFWRARADEIWTSFVMEPDAWIVEPIVGCGNCFGPGYNPAVENNETVRAFGCVCGGHVVFDGNEDEQDRMPFMISGPELTKVARAILTRGIS